MINTKVSLPKKTLSDSTEYIGAVTTLRVNPAYDEITIKEDGSIRSNTTPDVPENSYLIPITTTNTHIHDKVID